MSSNPLSTPPARPSNQGSTNTTQAPSPQGSTMAGAAANSPTVGSFAQVPSPSSNTQATAVVAPRVVRPLMGGVLVTEEGGEVAWVGGRPNSTWTGLQDPHAALESPSQLRSRGSNWAKGELYRRKGMESKLTIKRQVNSSFIFFRDKLVQHAEHCGMDTIMCVPDPADLSKMILITTYYAKFTVETVRTVMTTQTVLWDSYDKSNNRDLVAFLMNSLDDRSEQMLLDNKHDDDDTFVVIWMVLL